MFGTRNKPSSSISQQSTSANQSTGQNEEDKVHLLDPRIQDTRQQIFSYLSFEDASRLRLVSREFNKGLSLVLTQGYKDFSKTLDRERQQLKRELPRRESDRRGHKLYSYSETISSLETRRDLLEMTYKKYMDKNYVCFIPGKVLDEGFRLLKHLRSSRGRINNFGYDLLKDFRDLSSMAIEHFDEHIAPALRAKCDNYLNEFLLEPRRSLSKSLNESFLASERPSSSFNQSFETTSSLAVSGLQYQINELRSVIMKNENAMNDTLRSTLGCVMTCMQEICRKFHDMERQIGYSTPDSLPQLIANAQKELESKTCPPDYDVQFLEDVVKPASSTKSLKRKLSHTEPEESIMKRMYKKT